MEPRPKRVLLVDDDENALPMIAEVLEHSGFEVRTSTSVDQVLSSLGEWRPDVILTDVNMPGTSGVELCRQLKAAYASADVPVVLLSSHSHEALELIARSCEADGFLSKSNLAQLPRELTLLINALF